MIIRLDKYLSEMQGKTRSQIKELIRKKQVKVNGDVVTKPEFKIDTDTDEVVLAGESIRYVSNEYYLLNKPKGVVSATKDDLSKTVVDLIESRIRKDLFPVGRLDKDTTGLLIITNDGELSHRLLSPKRHVDKTYTAIVDGCIDEKYIKTFAEGFYVDDELTALPSELVIDFYDSESNTSHITLTIHEGKFHQIKRMFKAIGSEVIELRRISFGGILLPEDLDEGQYRQLTNEELELLRNV